MIEKEIKAFTHPKVPPSLTLFSRIRRKIKCRFRSLSNQPITYHYPSFSIHLPPNHLLAENQQFHPKYDRFLPLLASYINPSDIIVDIGANVGDTLASMIDRNPAPHYICIEADSFFFRYLTENIKRIKQSLPNTSITTIQALIGKSLSGVTLSGNNSTKNAVLNGGTLSSQSLDTILPGDKKIRVLKSDVDGFDYDVLDSSLSLIKQSTPILFFECQYEFEYQKTGYLNTIKTLSQLGYCDWVLFDNFGEVIIRTHQIDTIEQVLNYIWKQNLGYASRTIYYVDILAVQKSDTPLLTRILQAYSPTSTPS